MAKYIDADKLIAEIERLRKEHTTGGYYNEAALVLNDLEDYADSLQQEQPEVDLDKEIEEWIIKGREDFELDGWVAMGVDCIARHFYELGLNARKEE